jgi:hypothetical protein
MNMTAAGLSCCCQDQLLQADHITYSSVNEISTFESFI